MSDTKTQNEQENIELESMVHDFLENQVEQKFVALMEKLEGVNVYVPAMPPQNMPPEMLERIKAGENVAATAGIPPQPYLLRKSDGTNVLPIFTTKEQIPEEKRTPMLLYMPYSACVALVMGNQDKIQEIALNPFTEGLTINKPPIEVAFRRFQARQNGNVMPQGRSHSRDSEQTLSAVTTPEATAGGTKTVQMSGKEFRHLVNNRAATVILPMFFLGNPEKAMEQFMAQKEKFLLEIFASLYPEGAHCDYETDDFSILTMQVSDTLQIVRIDLPSVQPMEESVLRIYLAVKDEKEIRYYVVQRTAQKEENRILRIYEDKHQEVLMTLDDYGSEISEIMSLAEKG